MKKHIKIAISALILTLILAHAPKAQAGALSDIFATVDQQLENVNNLYTNLKNKFEELGESVDIQIDNIKGALGLPDLEEIAASAEEELAKEGRLDELGALKTHLEAEAITNHAQTILGQNGQQLTKQTQQALADAVSTVAALESQANDRQVSQEVLKDLAAQQTQMAVINNSLNSSMQELNRTTAYNNRAIAKQIRQQKNAQINELRKKQTIVNTELAALSVLQKNLHGSRPCPKGSKTAFITTKDGQPINPIKVCQ